MFKSLTKSLTKPLAKSTLDRLVKFGGEGDDEILQFTTTIINITPTYGANLVDNPDMETGSPPTGWNASNSTLTGVADERTGGAGVQAINIARNGNNAILARRAITAVAGTRIQYGGWFRNVDCTDGYFSLKTASPSTIHQNMAFDAVTSWHERTGTALLSRSDAQLYLEGRALAGTDGLSVRYDDVYAKAISDYFELYDHGVPYGDFSVWVTRAKGYQGGLRVNQQADDYYTECWVDYGLNVAANVPTVHLIDRIGNTVTYIGSWSITYVADAKLTLRVNKDGTREVIYNGTTLASGIATSGLTGTQAGPFLTDANPANVAISRYKWDARAA